MQWMSVYEVTPRQIIGPHITEIPADTSHNQFRAIAARELYERRDDPQVSAVALVRRTLTDHHLWTLEVVEIVHG